MGSNVQADMCMLSDCQKQAQCTNEEDVDEQKYEEELEDNYHCHSAVACRGDRELYGGYQCVQNEFSHIPLLLYISTAI